jgi:tetratricopeptide (TPR) repeat protein
MKQGMHDLTPFVGRAHLLAALEERLGGGERLVTVTGLPGVGKSRLVREWVRQHDDAGQRVERVGLGGVGADEAAGRLEAIAAADPEPDARRVIWLDDCDAHLDAIAELAAESLDRTDAVTFLLTTPETLGLAGECRLRVPPLQTAAAVDLYVQLARKAHDGFEAAASVRAAIAELVDALDRLPLAIEIAAERVAALPPGELARRLPDELELLERRRTPRVERHRSVVAAFDGSLQRLCPAERDVLVGCTTFAGGFDMQAAEAVFDEEIDDLLEVLESLERRSLLRLEATDERPPRNRYVVGQLVGAIAAHTHRGAPRGEMKTRHVDFFARRCRQALVFSDLDATSEQIKWLVAEAKNIVAAARRAIEQGAWVDAATLLAAADIVRRCRGPIGGIDEAIDAVVEGADGELDAGHLDAGHLDAGKLGELHAIRGERHKREGRLEESEEDWSRALRLAERADDHAAQIWMRLRLAEACRMRTRLAEAAEHLDEASKLLEGSDIPCLRSIYLAYRACCLVDDGEMEQARGHLARLVHLPPHPDLLKEFENLRSQIYARYYLQDESALAALSGRLATLLDGIDADRLRASYARLRGDLAHARRQLPEARDFYTDALQVFRGIGEDYLCGVITASLGGVALLGDDTEQALRYYEESLEIHRRLQRHVHTVQILMGVASLHHEQGRHRDAETHYLEAVEVADSTGTPARALAWTQMLRGWNGAEVADEHAADWLDQTLDGLASPAYLTIARLSLAIALYRRGERDRAEAL